MPIRAFVLPLLCLALSSLACAPVVTFSHGVASGDVTDTSAVLWTRTDRPSDLRLELRDAANRIEREISVVPSAVHADKAVFHAPIGGLRPGTTYLYRFVSGGLFRSSAAEGRFRTAPAPDDDALPRFVFGGDLGGQGFCRHVERGYDVFSKMLLLEPDAFVANGDMIYADGICPAEGPEGWPNLPGTFPSVVDVEWTLPEVREVIDAHWSYNRVDPYVLEFLAEVPVYVQWDDHEVINDFGAGWDRWPHQPEKPGYPELVAAGRDALFDWNPIRRNSDEPHRIYRSFRWGRHLELFLIDARSYRSPNAMPDGPEKTLLGPAQREWLSAGVLASDATWKVISSDVPLTLPTGWPEHYGRDGFADGVLGEGREGTPEATGAEDELVELLERFDTADVQNLVVMATDVHFAMSLRWSKDFDGDGDELTVHELISGPLNAVSVPAKQPDPSFGPEVLYSEGELFNFATLALRRTEAGSVDLHYAVHGAEDGLVRPGSELVLTSSDPRSSNRP
ncbi:MAG: alkaline phosphatase D family protein [Thermoanaerobaculia bacterium]|nr:alkaline phosphatase D family protein [Thermoanaerobaculia bacterium]